MKKISFLITFLCSSVIAQQAQFKNEKVETIVINARTGAYQFDDSGTMLGYEEQFSLSFDKSSNKYIIAEHFKQESKSTFEPDTSTIQKTTLKAKIGKSIKTVLINDFLNSLSTEIQIQNLISQVDTNNLQNFLSKKRIRKIAKKYDIDWRFERSYRLKRKNLAFYDECRSIDTFKIYLFETFENSGYAMVTDYSNSINILVTTDKGKYSFYGRFPNSFKQPWLDESDSTSYFGKSILNFDINKTLILILPKKFYLKKSISPEALYYDYLKWYLRRRNFLF
jgi:hypothetical protein